MMVHYKIENYFVCVRYKHILYLKHFRQINISKQ